MVCCPPWRLAIVVSMVTACSRPNPAFDLQADGSGGGSSGGVASSSSTTEVDRSSTSAASGDGDEGSSEASTGIPEIPRVLLVTQDGSTDFPLDRTLRDVLLELGAEVEAIADVAATASDAADFDAVVISETATGSEISGTFRDVDRPVIAFELDTWVAMDMAVSADWGPGTHVVIVAPEHPLAAGLSGEVRLLVDDLGSGISRATPVEGALVIAQSIDMPGAATIFALEEGAPLVGGMPAPAARVALGADVDASGTVPSTSDLSPEGVALFVAAVEWVL